jgi:hypothetical protein
MGTKWSTSGRGHRERFCVGLESSLTIKGTYTGRRKTTQPKKCTGKIMSSENEFPCTTTKSNVATVKDLIGVFLPLIFAVLTVGMILAPDLM